MYNPPWNTQHMLTHSSCLQPYRKHTNTIFFVFWKSLYWVKVKSATDVMYFAHFGLMWSEKRTGVAGVLWNKCGARHVHIYNREHVCKHPNKCPSDRSPKKKWNRKNTLCKTARKKESYWTLINHYVLKRAHLVPRKIQHIFLSHAAYFLMMWSCMCICVIKWRCVSLFSVALFTVACPICFLLQNPKHSLQARV